MKKELRPLGLYIHIPFCRCKCAYCDFYSLPGQDSRMDEYLEAITKHLKEVAPRAAAHEVDTIYFGGGTPSIFGAERLKKLLKTIRKEFRVAKHAEITLEANPESAREVKELKSLRRAGFNRISLGVQSMDDEMLRRLGRVHSVEDVRTAVAAIRKAGIKNLSLDLMYALPGQTMAHWQQTLADTIALQPEHLSCYALKIEDGTPFAAQQETLDLADDDTQAEMYLAAVKTLADAGYIQYEISNFSREGFHSHHNSKYWELKEYAGFGPGAHSDFGDVRYAYEKDLESYLRGELCLSESTHIPSRERTTEYLMLGLRTVKGISRGEFESISRFPFSCIEPVLLRCRDAGYAVEENGRWHLTPTGFLVSNGIINEVTDAALREQRRRIEAIARGSFCPV
ncbi:MAG: radical SAM family heme chaperone HemW [Oscillospiraceae bacterium]|nr:radical SAM family heme chaperone HemW [Oscillospiraceae bacterium]